MRRRCGWTRRGYCITDGIMFRFWILAWILTSAASQIQAIQQTSDPLIVEHPVDLYVVKNEPATLTCKAEGQPPPVISWYHNGQLVSTSNENPVSHRMMLPGGQLLIMKVMKVHGRNGKSDVGEYYCNATNPETGVSSISRKARLEVAGIQDDFREFPDDQDEAVGQTVVLRCVAPHGEPDPEVRWERDRQRLALDDRVRIDRHGSLLIDDARREDSGAYRCVAFNVAGERESRPAQLTVKEKPVIIEGPKNSVVMENGDVVFQCRATGDPELVGSWTKREGPIPTERSTIFADRSLQIRTAQVSDEGTYVCIMENSVGWHEAEATLAVHSRPSFVVAPRDRVVNLGRKVSIRCEMTGNPAPGVFWTRVSNQTLLLPNKPYERFRVTEEGTLIIESVRSEDAGEYACTGLNLAGSAYAKVHLDIKDVDSRPPPVIDIGPQNQTLPSNDAALLPCTASGEPAPGISWLKNGVTLSLEEQRFTIVESGTLQISNLKPSDSGLYTCKAVSETGETTWTAALVVESSTNTQIIFQRNQLSTTFPGAPLKPVATDIQETSLRLTWKTNSYTGTSAVTCYVVEYFSHEMGEGWVVMFDCIKDTSVLVRNLQPNTSYMFLVRARNSHGLSSPSPVSSPARTKGQSSVLTRPAPPLLDLDVVADKLALPVVHLATPDVLSSTAIKLTWEVQRNNQRYIEGFYVNYWAAVDRGEDATNEMDAPGQVVPLTETIQPSTATMCILSDLEKYTLYEMRLQPFYSTVKGAESNAVRMRTLEDVPSGSPRNIETSLLDNNTLIVSWEPPVKHHRNGVILGYKIYMFGNESKFDHEIQVNATAAMFVIPNVLKEVFYKLYMTAYNGIGEGVKSNVINVGQVPGEANKALLMEPWFIALLVVTVGAALWFALCIFSVWIYRRQAERKKGKKSHIVTVPVHRAEENVRTGIIPNQIPLLATNNGDLVCRSNLSRMPNGCYDNKSPSDGECKVNGSQSILGHTYQTLESLQRSTGVETSNSHDFPFVDGSYSTALPLPPLLKNLYGRGVPPLPYATATLMGNGSGAYHRKMSAGGSIPNPEAYMIQATGTISDGLTKREADNDRLRSSSLTQTSLFTRPPIDHFSQSISDTYQSDHRAKLSNGGPTANQSGYSYGLPAMCLDCDQRQYDMPCDRASSLESQTNMLPLSNGYHNTPLFLPDPKLLSYVAYDSICSNEKTQECTDFECRSSASSDEPEVDFTDAVSEVADFSCLMTGSDGIHFPEARGSAKWCERVSQPGSPCSYSAAPRQPYPTPERKNHLQGRSLKTGTASQTLGHNNNFHRNDLEDHICHYPSIPYSTANSSSSRTRVGNFGSLMGCSLGSSVVENGGGGQKVLGDTANLTSTHPSLLFAFDKENTPIV